MAITLIKKPAAQTPASKKVIVLGGISKSALTTKAVKPLTASVEDMSQREKDALAAVGLLEVAPTLPPPEASKKPTKGSKCLADGTKIRITNDMFSWLEQYKTGDTGVIAKSWPPTAGALSDEDPERYRLYEVKLDNPRTSEIVCVRGWEMEAR